jgi:hypothetical protein
MKFYRYLVLATALAMLGGLAAADTIDPVIGVKGGSGSFLWPGTLAFTINNTNSSCDGETSVCTGFVSPVFFSATTITSFDFAFDRSQPSAGPGSNQGFMLDPSSIFPTLTVKFGSSAANPEAVLSGGTILPCPLVEGTCGNYNFEFALAISGVFDGSVVTVTSAVPEPGTMILLGSGLAAVGLRRLRKKKAQTSLVA